MTRYHLEPPLVPSRHGGHSLCAAGFSAGRAPWGVQWGGPAQSTFFKDLLLQPMPGARGLRLDTANGQNQRAERHRDDTRSSEKCSCYNIRL